MFCNCKMILYMLLWWTRVPAPYMWYPRFCLFEIWSILHIAYTFTWTQKGFVFMERFDMFWKIDFKTWNKWSFDFDMAISRQTCDLFWELWYDKENPPRERRSSYVISLITHIISHHYFYQTYSYCRIFDSSIYFY